MPLTVTLPDLGERKYKPFPRRLMRTSDGDTPQIEQPIRMVSCDTPEKAHYAGLPPTAQATLNKARDRLASAFYSNHLPGGLREYLAERITSDAAARHIGAGNRATAEFERLQQERLTREDGKQRRLAIIPTGEVIDTYGRMLAYIAPYYANTASDPLPPSKSDPRRSTFNLNMVASGWAVFFPVYPSLHQPDDFNRILNAAELAWQEKRGAWNEFGADLLLAYEFRMCVKLARAASAAEGISGAFQRTCVDLRSMKNVGPHGFPSVPPPYRLWIWNKDVAEATQKLALH
ncbi:MAG: thermonuclease family protein [Burkholderiales bacterium]